MAQSILHPFEFLIYSGGVLAITIEANFSGPVPRHRAPFAVFQLRIDRINVQLERFIVGLIQIQVSGELQSRGNTSQEQQPLTV